MKTNTLENIRDAFSLSAGVFLTPEQSEIAQREIDQWSKDHTGEKVTEDLNMIALGSTLGLLGTVVAVHEDEIGFADGSSIYCPDGKVTYELPL